MKRALIIALLLLTGCQHQLTQQEASKYYEQTKTPVVEPEKVYAPVHTTIAHAKQVVLGYLKDPDSAKFAYMRSKESTVTSNPGTIVCGSVNSRNGFGGYTGFEGFAVVGNVAFFTGDYADNVLYLKFCG